MPVADGTARPAAIDSAFTRLKSTVSPQDEIQFHSTTIEEVWKAARSIEKQLAARQSLRNLRRIEPLLQSLEQYKPSLDTLCNGTPFLPWIWAPIKLMLQIAVAYPSAFEKLIEAYALIGECLPRFDRLSASFKNDNRFKQVLSLVYDDILEFHRRAYKFFRRRGWKIFFDATWKNFDARFKSILERLRKHQDLVDREAASIEIVTAQKWREDWKTESEWEEKKRENAQLRNALAWLAIDEGQENTLEKYASDCLPGSCDWILDRPKITAWLAEGADKPLVWLRDIPGAGKSTLASFLCEAIRKKTKHTILYYFCEVGSNTSPERSHMMRNLAAQLLQADHDLAAFTLEAYVDKGLSPSLANLKALLPQLILATRSTRIVIDGLDQSNESEQTPILSILTSFFGIQEAGPGICKILVTSRETSILSKNLQSKTVINLRDEQTRVNKSIRKYVNYHMDDVRSRFEAADETHILRIEDKIVSKADGMFLWVKLVLSTIQEAHSIQELDASVDELPEGLDPLYGHILRRFDRLSKTNQAKATRTLQWMAFSFRPLKMYEVQDGIALHAANDKIDERTKLKDDVLDLCKPLVQEGPAKTLIFVHFSAREYLLHQLSGPYLQENVAHCTIALSCVAYLSCSISDFLGANPNRVWTCQRVAKGYHGLHMYAIEFWLKHLLAYASSCRSCSYADEADALALQVRNLAENHEHLASSVGWESTVDPSKSIDVDATTLDDLNASWNINHLAMRVLSFDCYMSSNKRFNPARDKKGDDMSYSSYFGCAPGNYPTEVEEDPTLFAMLRYHYQQLVERLLSTNAGILGIESGSLSRFKEVYGDSAYVCRYRGCARTSSGFSNPQDCEQHERQHLPRLKCADPKCAFYQGGFRTPRAVKAHNEKYHSGSLGSDSQSKGARLMKTRIAPTQTGDAIRFSEKLKLRLNDENREDGFHHYLNALKQHLDDNISFPDLLERLYTVFSASSGLKADFDRLVSGREPSYTKYCIALLIQAAGPAELAESHRHLIEDFHPKKETASLRRASSNSLTLAEETAQTGPSDSSQEDRALQLFRNLDISEKNAHYFREILKQTSRQSDNSTEVFDTVCRYALDDQTFLDDFNKLLPSAYSLRQPDLTSSAESKLIATTGPAHFDSPANLARFIKITPDISLLSFASKNGVSSSSSINSTFLGSGPKPSASSPILPLIAGKTDLPFSSSFRPTLPKIPPISAPEPSAPDTIPDTQCLPNSEALRQRMKRPPLEPRVT